MMFPAPVVDADWLLDNRGTVEIADVRWSIAEGPKTDAFVEGHIPGAVFVDLDTRLSGRPGSAGRHPLASVDRFRRSLVELGLGRRPTVCYDDSSGATAARMWWMLDAIGHPAAVLDGGLAAWAGAIEGGGSALPDHQAAGEVVDPNAIGDPHCSDWPAERLISVDQIIDRIDRGTILLDARSEERFKGEPNPIDPVRGHIPGAVSHPWSRNLTPRGRFLPPDELRQSFAHQGVEADREWMASCGSGVTACHNLLAARVAGLGDGRLYAGSWSEWIADRSRPVEVGYPTGATRPGSPDGE